MKPEAVLKVKVLSIQALAMRQLLSWPETCDPEAALDLYSRCLVSGLLRRDEVPSSSSVTRSLLDVMLDYGLLRCLQRVLQQCLPGGRLAAQGMACSGFVDWLWRRVDRSKRRLDSLCRQLYDLSGISLDSRQIGDLCGVRGCFNVAEQLFGEALDQLATVDNADGIRQSLNCRLVAVSLLHSYARNVEWFCGVKLLPETRNGRFSPSAVEAYYAELRENSEHRPLVDGLVELCGGPELRLLWLEWMEDRHKRDPATVFYPPPSLQALLCMFLKPVESNKDSATDYKVSSPC